MNYRALIPVKTLTQAKSRLTGYLSPAQREELVLSMLTHVVKTLQSAEVFREIAVVSPDSRVLREVAALGARAMPEQAAGHNPALHMAARTLWQESEDLALVTISADLPYLQAEDVREFVALATDYPVVLAASTDQTGTNALCTRPPFVIPYLFGVNSLPRYQAAASEHKLVSCVYNKESFGFDLDTIEDFHCLPARWKSGITSHSL